MRGRKPFHELDLSQWRTYTDLITDSLWLLGKRDNQGTHKGDYWGNFVPQIPYQAMRRFTRQGELVIDPFAGSGTTLIEARRLGRHAIGVELNPTLVEESLQRVQAAPNPCAVHTAILQGDSTQPSTIESLRALMDEWGFEDAHLLILHPPYHDIIRFSDSPQDLSNAPDVETFLTQLEQVARNFTPLLQPGRYLVLVIGDKYAKGEWVPLGFYAMERLMRLGYTLKSLCVKDIQENRGKRGQYALWRYRALRDGLYVFKHEYVMFFVRNQG